MHTKLTEFFETVKNVAAGIAPDKPVEIRGLENLRSGKLQSLRSGRITRAVEQIAGDDRAAKIEVVVLPRVPETMHTVIVKAVGPDGKPARAILETVNILQPTEQVELEGCPEIDDRRPPLGKH